jgi:DDE superfamily endonuclease
MLGSGLLVAGVPTMPARTVHQGWARPGGAPGLPLPGGRDRAGRPCSPSGGTHVGPSTIYDWVQHCTPLYQEAARARRPAARGSWSIDETYIKVAGVPQHVFRAIDEQGPVIDVSVGPTRGAEAASAFLRRSRRPACGRILPPPTRRRSTPCCVHMRNLGVYPYSSWCPGRSTVQHRCLSSFWCLPRAEAHTPGSTVIPVAAPHKGSGRHDPNHVGTRCRTESTG